MLYFPTKKECLDLDRKRIKAVIKKIRKTDKAYLRRKLAFYLDMYREHKHMQSNEF